MSRKIIGISFIIFVSAFIIQTIDLNTEGRTWDEQFKTDTGIAALKNIATGTFSYEDWAVGFEHPPIAKYIYGLSFYPELKTIDPKNVTQEEYSYLLNENYYAGMKDGLIKIQPYDFTLPRLVSAGLNALTIMLVFLIGYVCFHQMLLGIVSSVILISIPRFFAMGRLMTFESISGFLTTLLFFIFLKKNKKLNMLIPSIISGTLLGSLLWTRYNNISVFFTYTGWVMITELFKTQKEWGRAFFHIFFSYIIAGVVGFTVWPFLWIDFPRGIFATVTEHKTRVITSSFYHIYSFLQTTPTFYLILLLVGLLFCIKNKSRNFILLLWWFFSTICFFVLFTSPGGGTRYMFVVYPATALIAAAGLLWLLSKVKKFEKSLVFFCLMLYGIVTLSSVHPYYLDYYNGLVGGIKGAAQKKLEISWWGEGQREAGLWLKQNTQKNAKIGLMVTPKYVFPRVRTDTTLLPYGEQIDTADYVVVSKSDLVTFKKTKGIWKEVYQVNVQNVSLIYVYEREK